MASIFGSKSKSFMTMSIPPQSEPSISRPVRDDNKIDTILKAINDRIKRALLRDTAKHPKLDVNSTSPVLSAHSYPTEDPQCSSHPLNLISAIKTCSKETNHSQKDQMQAVIETKTQQKEEPEQTLENEFKDLHLNFPVLEISKRPKVVGEGINRSIFGVKETNLGKEEVPYATTLGKLESYAPRPSTDRIGARTPYYARKDFIDCHMPEDQEMARDAELYPFEDVLVFWRMVEFLGALPINHKRNRWESEDLIENPINWNKPPKYGDGTWHIPIKLIDPDCENFKKTFQSLPTTRKLSQKESPSEIIDLDHFHDT
ncbi:hypothetical protein Tco_0498993 [Tanacetum coccineum]